MWGHEWSERRRRDDARACAPEPSPPSMGAQLLTLQRSAGNRATAELLERSRERLLLRNGEWAVSKIRQERKDVAAEMEEIWGKGVALHHTISKERMSAMGEDLGRDLNDPDEDVRAAAQEFWAAVKLAAGEEVFRQATAATHGQYARTLHNLRLNLEAGPANPGSNPGTGMDPVTVAQKGEDRRVLDPVSEALAEVDAAYRTLRVKPKEHALHWRTMAEQLEVARVAHAKQQGGKIGKHEGMWFKSDDVWYRKGERLFPGQAAGEESFASQDAPDVEDIAGYLNSEEVVAEHEEVFDRPGGASGPPIRIRIEVTEAVLAHSCVRHTYRHFNFAGIKAVNNFWPVEYDYSTLEALAPSFAEAIAAHCKDAVLDSPNDYLEPEEYPDNHVKGRGVPAGEHSLFFIGVLTPEKIDGKFWWRIAFDTIAPENQSAETFTVEELRALGAQRAAVLAQRAAAAAAAAQAAAAAGPAAAPVAQ